MTWSRSLRPGAPGALFVAAGLLWGGACAERVEVGSDQVVKLGDGGAAGSAGGASGSPAGELRCQGQVYACGDGIDNDGDGHIDADDPECLGPCDNTEDSYYGGIPGQENPRCDHVDCYFDRDTGHGNDDCRWSHHCDPLSLPDAFPPSGDPACEYAPESSRPHLGASCEELAAEQSAQCLEFCRPLTPNGCDCFGCCELPAGSGSFVWIGSMSDGAGTCDSASLGDPSLCKPCTPVTGCFNPCDECELCAGKTELPESCGDAGAEGQCPGGGQPCGRPGQAPCGEREYCVTGCCTAVPR